jgi:UDP-N-acetylglucosamine 3-dehydrogenase
LDLARVGLVGTSSAAQLHMSGYKEIHNANVVSVCSRKKEHVMAFATNYNVPSFYTDYETMLEKENVDIVDICTPPYLHKDMAVRALETGRHVLCEKPIAIQLEDADEMITKAERNGLKLMIAHCYRFDPAHIEIKSAIDKGEIGMPRYIRAVKWWVKGGKEMTPDNEYTKLDKFGGLFIEALIHNADVLRWYLDCEPTETIAIAEKLIRSDWEMQDFVASLYRFANGSIGFLECCAVAPLGYPTRRDIVGHLEIMGEKGSIRWDDTVSPAELVTDQVHTYLHTENLEMYRNEIQHFIDCVLQDKTPSYPASEARAALQMCDASRKSALVRKYEKIPY